MSRFMIASDLHGDAEAVEKLIKRYRELSAERLILLGDLLYHGPRNDLPDGYAPKRVIELLNSMADELLCVRGNCDTEVDAMVLKFPILADYAYISCGDVRVFATHGHKFDRNNPPPLKPGEILLHGHTHVSGVWEFGRDNFCINPGSVSIPKEGTPKGFILWENNRFDFYDLDAGDAGDAGDASYFSFEKEK